MNTDIEKEFEGCKLVAYPDPGTGGAPWTIGYGHTQGVREGDTCTQEQAEQWLQEDLRSAVMTVTNNLTVTLNDDEVAALVDFVYNVGANNFTHSTLLRKVNLGDLPGAAEEFSRWNRGGGRVLAGLTRRRHAEAELFKQGVSV